MPLEPGEPAPTVTASNQHGESVTLAFAEPTVLYVYPEDGTPGCSTEADQFQLELDAYREAGVDVYGVSTDTVASHREFADDRGVEFELLADPDGELAGAFEVDLRNDGTAPRTTFVLAEGQVCGLYEGVRPDGHAREVLRDMLDMGLVSLE